MSLPEWTITPTGDARFGWFEVSPTGTQMRVQGWKLHISATAHSALAVLHAVLPVLKAVRAPFKVVRSLEDLAVVNVGAAGLSQIGKFITIYPNDDRQAVELGHRLHTATAGCDGPAILSDRRFCPGSIVFYRYGAFVTRMIQNRAGQMVPVITGPEGEVVEDVRTVFSPPPQAVNPFEPCGLSPIGGEPQVLRNRYLCTELLHRSAKTDVYLALDLDASDVRTCVVKRARRHIYVDDTASVDACAMLQREHDILGRLRDLEWAPRVVDIFTDDGDRFLVLEHIDGVNLRAYVSAQACLGRTLPIDDVVTLGLELCSMLQTLHERGFVHRDLKPANLVLTTRGTLALVDFELAHDLTDPIAAFAVAGTRGYRSPQQRAGAPPNVADDIFGLGNLLFFLLTNVDPSLAPTEPTDYFWWIAHTRPQAPTLLRKIIQRCTAVAPQRRFPSADAVATALDRVLVAGDPLAPIPRIAPTTHPDRYRALAVSLGHYLCDLAESAGEGLCWTSTHPSAYGFRQRDIQVGASGIALYLADLYAHTGSDRFRATAEAAWTWLAQPLPLDQPPLPGLYVGDSGLGLVALHLWKLTRRADFFDAAAAIGRRVFAHLPDSPDLFNGLAGCGLFLLLLWESTRNRAFEAMACTVGDQLIGLAESTDRGCRWTIPEGYSMLSGQTYLGFAHGSAGIASYLLDLYDATRRPAYLQSARAALDEVMAFAQPALDNDSGLNWPDTIDGQVHSIFWCHGAAGIGRALLRAFRTARDARAGQAARAAGRTILEGGRWLNPTQCHGLAGNIEFLLDLWVTTGEAGWRQGAFDLAEILAHHAMPSGEAQVWPSEEPTIVTPDFMVGVAGVAECFLRLSCSQHHPHLLSRDYFLVHS